MGFTLNNIYTGMGLPREFILRIQKEAHIPYFIETGTAGGESVAWAKDHFDECWTIEANQEREITKIEGVNYHAGNSSVVLPDILLNEKLSFDKPILFWLDAHYCEPVPNTSSMKECYLMEELEAIKNHQKAVIFIDDARLFAGPPPWPNDPRDWPRLDTIMAKLRECFPNHYTTIVDDFIVSVPIELGYIVDAEWRDNYKLRYRSEDQMLWESSNTAFNALLKYLDPKK